MLRKILLFLPIFILAACSSTAEGERLLTDAESAVLSRLDDNQLQAAIQELTQEPRIAGTESEQLAAAFLTTQLEQIGYEVDVNTFTIEGTKNESQNLIVTKKSSDDLPSTDDIIIIGAHYDSVVQSPGASDNASGTAVLLEVARMLKDEPIPAEIRFIFFGAEELRLAGSESYIHEMTTDETERTVAMFNLDMVGSAEAGPLKLFTVDGKPNTATQISSKVHEKLFGKPLSIGQTDRSDHYPFQNAGIEAVLFSYFPLEKAYHSPDDTIDKISKERMENVAHIIALSILKLTNETE